MEDAQQLVLLGLEQAGIALPPGIATLQDVDSTAALTSICSQALALINSNNKAKQDGAPIDDDDRPTPHALPQLMSERFRYCMDLAAAVQKLGYREDLSFHQFLYPSEASTYKLLLFLSEKLSSISGSKGQGSQEAKGGVGTRAKELQATAKKVLRDWLEGTKVDEGSSSSFSLSAKQEHRFLEGEFMRLRSIFIEGVAEGRVHRLSAKTKSSFLKAVEFREGPEFSPDGFAPNQIGHVRDEREEPGSLPESVPLASSYISKDRIAELEERLASLVATAEKLDMESIEAGKKAMMLEKSLADVASGSELLEKQEKMLQKALDMAMDGLNSPNDAVEGFQQVVGEKRANLALQKIEWEQAISSAKESIQDIERTARNGKTATDSKLSLIENTKEDIQAMTRKIRLREEEIFRLKLALEKSPKQAARSTYVRRIAELVKNSRKQDADIARIIQETRNLQRESNTVQDRLRRTHALVDELVFRDAKKNAGCQQAYKLLSSIHENFADIVEKISQTDKLGHEIQELLAKLEVMDKEQVDVASVQADIDAVSRENEALKAKLSSFRSKSNLKVHEKYFLVQNPKNPLLLD